MVRGYPWLLYTKILKRKPLQSDWVQSHKLSHNIVRFTHNIVISERNIVMFIVYVFLIWNDWIAELRETVFAFPNSPRCPVKTSKELPLIWIQILLACSSSESKHLNPHQRESSQFHRQQEQLVHAQTWQTWFMLWLKWLQVNKYSTHSAIMAFKNSKEHPLLSKFGS